MVVLRRRRQISTTISVARAIPPITHGAKSSRVDSFCADSPVPGFAGPVEAVSPGEGVGDEAVMAHAPPEDPEPACTAAAAEPPDGDACAAPKDKAGAEMTSRAKSALLRMFLIQFSLR